MKEPESERKWLSFSQKEGGSTLDKFVCTYGSIENRGTTFCRERVPLTNSHDHIHSFFSANFLLNIACDGAASTP